MSNFLFRMDCYTRCSRGVTVFLALVSVVAAGLFSPAFAQVGSSAKNVNSIHRTPNRLNTRDSTAAISSYMKTIVSGSDVIVVARVVGWTTPLKSLNKNQISAATSSPGSDSKYNTAIHLVILESLKGPYRVGDTIGYLQFGGRINDSLNVGSTDDLINSFIRNNNSLGREFLLFLTPYLSEGKKLAGVDRTASVTANKNRLIEPTEVLFPVFIPFDLAYSLEGDKVHAVGCTVANLFPESLRSARQFIKKAMK